VIKTISSGFIGAVSELIVEEDVLSRGFNVLRPVVPARFDLVVVTDDDMVRVQVKTGRYDQRNGTFKASFDTPYSPTDVDLIAVVDQGAHIVYYVPTSRLVEGVTNVTIRFEPSSRDSTGIMFDEVNTWPTREDSSVRV